MEDPLVIFTVFLANRLICSFSINDIHSGCGYLTIRCIWNECWIILLFFSVVTNYMTVSFNMYHLSCTSIQYGIYHNDSKFSDRQILAISVDPDQTAPTGAVWSGSTLFAIPSASFGWTAVCGKIVLVNFHVIITVSVFWCPFFKIFYCVFFFSGRQPLMVVEGR